MSLLQFSVWGAWLATLGTYGFYVKKWSGAEFGAVFSTIGIASIVTPALVGIIADRWLNIERLYGSLHLLYAISLLFLAKTENPDHFFWILLVGMLFYMPTIPLSYSLSYTILKKYNYDVIKDFPSIRIWGTIGFICSMWVTNIFSDPRSPLEFGIRAGEKISSLTGSPLGANQFYFASLGAFILSIYSLTLPKCPPHKLIPRNAHLLEKLGLKAIVLFKTRKMGLFLLFSVFLGASLQLTNMYGDAFLKGFGNSPEFSDSAVVRYSTIIISISQISEIVFIVAIPFFLTRFGIKKVILISMTAWTLRFGLFSAGSPDGYGLIAIIISNIIYGMAFDFFNISGSLFIETECDSEIRSSAQGLFMMMTNGFGAMAGSLVSGWIIQNYYIDPSGNIMWRETWLTFSLYIASIAFLFAIFFRHEHDPMKIHASH